MSFAEISPEGVIVGVIVVGFVVVGGFILSVAANVRRAVEAAGTPNGRPPENGRPPKTTVFYRTQDGGCDYQFAFVNTGGAWKIYILSQPSYQGRQESAHSTHRLRDADGQ